MATTGIGSGLCEDNVLVMAIENPGEQTEGGRCVELGWARQGKVGQGVKWAGNILGYPDRVTIQTVIHVHI